MGRADVLSGRILFLALTPTVQLVNASHGSPGRQFFSSGGRAPELEAHVARSERQKTKSPIVGLVGLITVIMKSDSESPLMSPLTV